MGACCLRLVCVCVSVEDCGRDGERGRALKDGILPSWIVALFGVYVWTCSSV